MIEALEELELKPPCVPPDVLAELHAARKVLEAE